MGEPILPKRMWHPDAVLRVEDIEHAPITIDRVDKAAAVQLVFEDALFHIVQHLIRTTRSTRLVLTGGTALNCVANMRLLEQFDAAWYERNLGMKDATLHLWVPPVPGDAGRGDRRGVPFRLPCRSEARRIPAARVLLRHAADEERDRGGDRDDAGDRASAPGQHLHKT